MKDEKAFTLIELLAVILILGVIALIAIPTITSIITDSSKSAFKETANNLLSSLENKCELQRLKGTDITKQYIFFSDGVYPEIEMKGSLPINGSAMVNDNCEVSLSVSNEKFTINKQSNEDTLTISDGDTASLQANKFYFDNAKKILIYYMNLPETYDDNLERLTEIYGEELANLMIKSNKVAMIYYVDENDIVIAYYPEVSGYNLSFGSEDLHKYLKLIKPFYEREYASINVFVQSHILTTDIGIFLTAGDYITISESPNRPAGIPTGLKGLTVEQINEIIYGDDADQIDNLFTLKVIE